MRIFGARSAACFLWVLSACDPSAGALDHAHDHDNDQDHDHEHQHEAQETEAFFGDDAADPRSAAGGGVDDDLAHEHDHDDDEHDHAHE